VTSSRADAVCAYCGRDSSSRLYDTDAASGEQYTLRSCDHCRAIFLTPHPTRQQLLDAYSDEYYGETERKFIAPIEKTIDWFRAGRARRVAKSLPTKGRVLDIGCGNGGFLNGIADLGYEACGIELPGGSAERAKKVPNIEVHVGALEDGAYIGERFDAITMWHVFEHLVEPRKTLERCAEMLDAGGRLYLSLPNIDSWQARIFKGDWFHADPPRHLFFLGPDALTAAVAEYGFERESISFHSLEQNPYGIVQSALNKVVGERDLLYEALKGNTEINNRHSRWSLLGQKLLFVASAPIATALAFVESAAGRGGTMELVFVKTGGPESS